MSMETLGWIAAAVSLIGVVLNIRHDRRCFIVWGITNATWVIVDAQAGVWSQAALQALYCGLSVWGWRHWR